VALTDTRRDSCILNFLKIFEFSTCKSISKCYSKFNAKRDSVLTPIGVGKSETELLWILSVIFYKEFYPLLLGIKMSMQYRATQSSDINRTLSDKDLSKTSPLTYWSPLGEVGLDTWWYWNLLVAYYTKLSHQWYVFSNCN
jgi:hypothetical protein